MGVAHTVHLQEELPDVMDHLVRQGVDYASHILSIRWDRLRVLETIYYAFIGTV